MVIETGCWLFAIMDFRISEFPKYQVLLVMYLQITVIMEVTKYYLLLCNEKYMLK